MTVAHKSSPSNHQEQGQGDVAFNFVQALASELSGGKIELPGFPHIVMRVQKVLGDENADASRIVKVLGSEPMLASQIVRMANSAALNTAGSASPTCARRSRVLAWIRSGRQRSPSRWGNYAMRRC